MGDLTIYQIKQQFNLIKWWKTLQQSNFERVFPVKVASCWSADRWNTWSHWNVDHIILWGNALVLYETAGKV